MSTDNLSGAFTYNSLKNALKQHGVQTKNMNSALTSIANKNHIDDIKNLNGEKRINVDSSIFNKFATPIKIDTKQDDDLLKAYNLDISNIKDDVEKLPEIFNADDYDVVDYDDYYGFTDSTVDNNKNENNTPDLKQNAGSEKMDFETFKKEFQTAFGNKFNLNGNENKLRQLFNTFDANSDSNLDKSEQNALKFTFQGLKQHERKIESFSGKEDSMGDGIQIEMGMSNDSFNPQ